MAADSTVFGGGLTPQGMADGVRVGLRAVLTDGKLLVKRCRDCGEHHHYPRDGCPFCGSLNTEWRQARGQGTIYSFSVMRRAEVPYVVAYVTLDEGPSMMTNIVDADADALCIGQRVAVRFQPSEGGPPLPVFVPV